MKPWREIAIPHADVLKGTFQQSEFAADITAVHSGKAPVEYQDPAAFFARTHITGGMRLLLTQVAQRLSGKGGEPVIQLQTAFGGGKTHGLIALVHAVRGMKGVENVSEFIDPKLLPKGEVRVAALDGENSDPANGLRLEGNFLARSLWGEMAYRLAGKEGFERAARAQPRAVAAARRARRPRRRALRGRLRPHARRARGRGARRHRASPLSQARGRFGGSISTSRITIAVAPK